MMVPGCLVCCYLFPSGSSWVHHALGSLVVWPDQLCQRFLGYPGEITLCPSPHLVNSRLPVCSSLVEKVLAKASNFVYQEKNLLDALVMKDTEKAELPNASFASSFIAKASPWESLILEVRHKVWRREDFPLFGKD